MSGEQVIEIGNVVEAQMGFKHDDVMKSLDFWKLTLLTCDFTKAQEGIRTLMLNNSVRKQQPGPWFSAIANYCGTATALTPKPYKDPENAGCERCRGSGAVEVPSDKDWNNNTNRWNGVYTMVVACDCGLGQMRACQTKNIRQYQAKFTNWESEYPLRMLQHTLRCVRKNKPTDQEDTKKRSARIAELTNRILAIGGDPDDGEIIE